MQPKRQKYTEYISKGLIKFAPDEDSFNNFCSQLKVFIEKINSSIQTNQTEENLKSHLEHFLKDAFYKSNAIETKSYKGQIQADLVIYQENKNSSPVEVLIEAKKPDNKTEMVSCDDLNKKALHEAIFYFLFEKVECKNNELKHLIITNFEEFYIFDAQDIAKVFFYEGSSLVKEFKKWINKKLDSTNTSLFYLLVKTYIEQKELELPFAFISLKDLAFHLDNVDKADSKKKLIHAYKTLCPYHLLKKSLANDSNTLNKEFYDELLHIIGLEEEKVNGKKLIQRKATAKRNQASFIEDLISKMQRGNKLRKVDNLEKWGSNQEEQLFNIALELSITWTNRILFLKLLEAQLSKYHNQNDDFLFLDTKKIHTWSDLSFLFFEVLAKKTNEREQDLKGFEFIPYLNSSLFETTDLEEELDSIDYLSQDAKLPVFEKTVLKDSQGKKLKNTELTTLEYLLSFLSAYDFGAEESKDLSKEGKTLINASVLGLIFEKINGYKDGSFFTPGYITMYMCRESIRKAVIEKFNYQYKLDCKDIEDLSRTIWKDKIPLDEANKIIDDLKICDPAVGSGHFLVSALNEIISIKSDLDILCDCEGKPITRYYKAHVENDELLLIDEETDEQFEYKVLSFDKNNLQQQRQVASEKTRIQKAIFHEKQKIIENCLFGVDINPNSVQICRLRLWIELLKNAYYISESNSQELQTLPNIDINIKQGNSLISRFDLEQKFDKRTNLGKEVENYKNLVQTYKSSTDKTAKQDLKDKIQAIKQSFHVDLIGNNEIAKKRNNESKKLDKICLAIHDLEHKSDLLVGTKNIAKQKSQLEKDKIVSENKINSFNDQLKELKEGQIYKTGFEWRFEFPEVLDEKGEFIGFDVVIGNPPYIRQEEIKDLKPYIKDKFDVFNSIADIYTYFIERGNSALKPNGQFAFIISNKFTRANYGESLRNYLLQTTELNSFVDFSGIAVFDSATVDAAILSFSKSDSKDNKELVYCNIQKDFLEKQNVYKYISENKIDFPVSQLTANSWAFEEPEKLKIKQKIEAQGKPLKEWDIEINYGIKTGCNEAFVIDGKKKDELIAKDPKCVEIIKPLLRGRDIQKWNPEFADLWLIGTFPSLSLDIEDYPSVKEHLLSFDKERLEQSGKKGARKKTNNEWFETQDNIAYWKHFEQPKIVYKDLAQKLTFCFDNENLFMVNTCYFLNTGNKYLLAVLNSKLIDYYYRDISVQMGSKGLRHFTIYIEKIPVKVLTEEQEKEFNKKVDEILKLKEADSNAGISDLEKEIDLMVYRLYGLTGEEAKIIDPTLTDSELALIESSGLVGGELVRSH